MIKKLKRQMSTSPQQSDTTSGQKQKKRHHIQPTGSEDDADAESDAGHEPPNTIKKNLHSTLKEDKQPINNQQQIYRQLSVPETPNPTINLIRYNTESIIKPPTSNHQEAFENQSKQQQIFTNGQKNGQ